MLRTAAPDDRARFSELRRREFSRLDVLGETYLDYAGSALYGETQIRKHHAALNRGLFGNPHSEHAASRRSADVIEATRHRVLRFFGVDESTHAACFAANTTAAIKLVAEAYPFDSRTPLVLSTDNHNSVNGIREYARSAGARVHYLPIDNSLRLLDAESHLSRVAGRGLLAFPGQSNFSGVLHDLTLVRRASEFGLDVLLDAAAFVPSHPLDLSEVPADFTVLSFYKMFGFPTGVGALIARHEALARLRRPWFSGGTVDYVSVALGRHRLHPRHEGFEDGTANFLDIAAIADGLELLETVEMPKVRAHVAGLTGRFLAGIKDLTHRTGIPAVSVYGPRTLDRRGGIVAFNLNSADGEPIPYTEVEARAVDARIAIRGGCFCNPGAAEIAFSFDPVRVASCLDSTGARFSQRRFRECLGGPVGAVRVSFGLANNDEDVVRALAFVASFLESAIPTDVRNITARISNSV
jgi:selenocysteine lyase/cysteine desulfurase